MLTKQWAWTTPTVGKVRVKVIKSPLAQMLEVSGVSFQWTIPSDVHLPQGRDGTEGEITAFNQNYKSPTACSWYHPLHLGRYLFGKAPPDKIDYRGFLLDTQCPENRSSTEMPNPLPFLFYLFFFFGIIWPFCVCFLVIWSALHQYQSGCKGSLIHIYHYYFIYYCFYFFKMLLPTLTTLHKNYIKREL